MLKSIAEFSKTVKKYSYYPMIIGFVGICAALAYEGSAALLGIVIAVICALLSAFALCSSFLCRKAGIDDKII